MADQVKALNCRVIDDNVSKVDLSVYPYKVFVGVIIDKEKVHPDMPEEIKNAKVALLNLALEIEKTNIDAQIRKSLLKD